MKFIGRQKELSILSNYQKRGVASFIVIRGRRRIGKSRLIEEFSKKFPQRYIFAGLPPELGVNAETQREEFATQMRQQGVPFSSAESWSDLFLALAEHCHNKSTLIALDEISWMGSKDPAFMGRLKNAWDLHFKKNPHLVLILSGSNSTWIEENILSSTGFVGRISYRMKLEELPLYACKEFFGAEASPYEIFKGLSVTGGVPRYLEEFRPMWSVEKNISALCFTAGGLLFNEFAQIFSSLFLQRASHVTALLEILKDGGRTIKELAELLGRKPGGDLVADLQNLAESGFVQRYRQWNLTSPDKGELYRYRISDNYIRFYLKFIAPKRMQIEQLAQLELPPGWQSILGLQFESLVLNHAVELHAKLDIPLHEIICCGPYFQTQTKRRAGCQIDYMVQTKFDTLYVCEIKFARGKLGCEVIAEVQEKLKRLQRPFGISIRPVLIHVNGVTDELLAKEYFAHIVDFAAFLEN